MQNSTSDLQSLVARLERLESQYQWLKSEVVTEKLVLVDAEGKTRATLRMFEGEPMLGLNDAEGTNRVCLRVSAKGPYLGLFDAKGNTSVVMTAGEHGPAAILYDANGKERLTLEITQFESGTPRLSMHNANGMASVVMTTVDDGPSVGLLDPANPDGNTSVRIQVNSKAAHVRARWLGVPPGHYEEPEGPSLLCVKDGKVLWSAP
jgi:hypothetical protein